MSQYAYTAREESGKLVNGVISAASLEAAGKELCRQNKFVIDLTEHLENAAGASAVKRFLNAKRVKRSDIIHFSNQMAVMVSTGVKLSEALNSLSTLCKNPSFRAVLDQVRDDVDSGLPLSEALAKHPRVFPTIMVSLVKASEASGTMGVMLDRISKYMMREYQTMRQVRGALIYPAAMFTICVSVTVFLLTFVLPRFASIYKAKGALLPAPTRLLMTTSDALVNYWPLWLGLVAAAGIGGMFWVRTQAGGRQMDWLKLHVPLFGSMLEKYYLSRATRTLGTMLEAGVPVLDAIEIVRGVTRNYLYDEVWSHAIEDLRMGQQLSDSLSATSIVPLPVTQMIHAGERSGRLAEVLGRLAEFMDVEFEQSVKTATQFIEPVMIVFMGSFIGFVAISLLLPIFSVGQVLSGNK